MSESTSSGLAPTLGVSEGPSLAPTMDGGWREFANIVPFEVPEAELASWFDTTRYPQSEEVRYLRWETAYYVNVVRYYKADPVTCCAHYQSFGRLGDLTPADVTELSEWDLLKKMLSLGYPANHFGVTVYKNQPGGAKPSVLQDWVRVKVDEWRIPERLAFLDRKAMKKAPTAMLVWQFGQAHAEHGRYRYYGKRNYRNLGKVLEKLHEEFIDRGRDAQRELVGLVRHSDPYVQVEAARLALELGSPDEGLPVLEALASDPTLHVAGLAETYLEAWRRHGLAGLGNPTFP